MIRRLALILSGLVVMLAGVAGVCEAQGQPVMTRHMREATLSGQAKSMGRLPATQTMQVDLVLPLSHPEELDNFLQALYDPNSPSYRHFVSPQEFTARFGPTQANYDAVLRFAKANGLKVVGGSRDGMDVQVEGTIENIEAAFHVVMAAYQHPTENRTFFAPDREPTVDLPFALWHISGLDNYSIPHPASLHKNLQVKSNVVKGSCPSAAYCGSDMRAAYYGGTALTGAGQTLGLLEFEGYDIADLNTYFANSKQTNNVPVVGVSVGGASLSCLASKGCDDTEQILDMTQAISMAPGLSALDVYVGNTDTAMLSAMSTHSPLNAQISSSWTWQPADASTDDPYFKKFAAQGQNYFQAAGDSGSYTSKSTDVFPADDPNVTTVGGTDLQVAGAGGAWSSETVWVDGGGGFFSKDALPIPTYQQQAGVITSANKGSTTLRNAPDVAGESNFDYYVCADQTTCTANEYGGTSFAAPMWAGYLALVNQQAVSNGSPVLGFINPLIYSIGLGAGYSSAFHDITSGSNGGFTAVTGYDLTTGWGSPNGAGLINALASGTPTPNFSISASPTSVSVVQGNNGTSTITTAVSGGFNSAIALTASGQPTGVTVSFSPTSIAAPGSGTSTMTMAVAATTATGTYTITVTGTGGGTTHTATVSLTVTAPVSGNFTLTASPTSLSITRSSHGTTTITIHPTNGFAAGVTLSATGMGSGVTAGFSPNPATGTSTLTLTASSTATTGTTTVTIKGVSGALSHTTTISLRVRR